MFDVGFSELMLISVVALVVIGPERMPKVARTAGALLGRAQRYINEVKADIQNEADAEEFSRIKATFYDATKAIEYTANQVRRELDATAASLSESVAAKAETPLAAPVEAPSGPAQLDLWPDIVPAAGPAASPNT
ncbi:MAG: twin-arginine translocase subunit TatB [Betaproteobacteria bacterium]|nr:twin-arginine translocase subunit TatB [Betaproteobacteria bacterium]